MAPRDLTAHSFSNDQMRVLQHAADIIGCRLDALVNLSRQQPPKRNDEDALPFNSPDWNSNSGNPGEDAGVALASAGGNHHSRQTTAVGEHGVPPICTSEPIATTAHEDRPMEWLIGWEDFPLEGLNAFPDMVSTFADLDGSIATANFSFPGPLAESGIASNQDDWHHVSTHAADTRASNSCRDATINFLARESGPVIAHPQPAAAGPAADPNLACGHEESSQGDALLRPNSATVSVNAANSSRKRRRINGGGIRRQRFDNPEDRRETARTRKIGACLRCHLLRTRVSSALLMTRAFESKNTSDPCSAFLATIASEERVIRALELWVNQYLACHACATKSSMLSFTT